MARFLFDIFNHFGLQLELNELEAHRGHTLLSKSLGHQHWVYTRVTRFMYTSNTSILVFSGCRLSSGKIRKIKVFDRDFSRAPVA